MPRWKRALLALLLTFLAAQAAYAAGLQVAVPTGGGTIANYGSSAVAGAGQTLCNPDATAVTAILNAYAAPNGGVSYTGYSGPDANGSCTGGSVAALPTPTPIASTSTLAPGAGAGASASASFVTGAGSTNTRGAIQWTTGTLPTAGAQVVVTFPQTYSAVPYVDCYPRTAGTAALQLYATSQSASGVTIASANAPVAATTYSCEYLVVP